MAHHRGPQHDASDNLSDNAGLADLGEGPVEEMADDDDEAGLSGISARDGNTLEALRWRDIPG